MYTTKTSLEVAVEAAARVDAVLAKKGRMKPTTPVTGTGNVKGSPKAISDLFSTEFEINDVPLSARNLLTKGITQEDINNFSGALISTRGRYIHPEDKGRICERPLYLHIQGPNKQSLDLAIQRIDTLIKEVMEQEVMKLRPNQPPPNHQHMMSAGVPQHAPMPVVMSMPGIEKVLVGLDHAPPSFDVRNKVLGPGGANLQYISNETGTIVTLRGRGSGFPEPNTGQESPEPLHLCVEHSKHEVLQQGRQLAFNLVETIQQEFAAIHGQQMLPPPSLLVPQGYQTVNVSQPAGTGMLTVQQPHDQTIHHNSTNAGGPPGAPAVVATSITVPVFTQQHAGQLVSVPPPPSLTVPPPQLMHQPPPPQVQIPPPGLHIPSQQGPLVPPGSAVQQQQQHHHLLIQHQPPPPPPQQVTTSQAAAVHLQLQHQQAAIAASQGQVQVSATLTQPPPTFTHSHPQMMTSPATQVINGIANQHQPSQLPHQQQAIITQTSYPVQYIQTNGQTIMAYPAGSIRPEQLAAAAAAAAQPGAQAVTSQQQLTHIPTQLQPGQQIVLQPTVAGQSQQVQLAQLMQNQTIQQHLLHQAQQGQSGTVMLLQYPPQSPQQQGHIASATVPPPPVVANEHNHGTNTIVRMPIVRMTVPIQQAPPDVAAQPQLAQLTATSGANHTMPPQTVQYSQQGKIIQPMQQHMHQQPPHLQSPPQQQLQMQIQPPPQIHSHQMHLPPHQQIQAPPPQQIQIQQPMQQRQLKPNQELQQENVTQQLGQKRRYPNSNNANNGQQLYQQQAPQPVPPPLHQHGGPGPGKQQIVKQHIQQRQGIGNVQHQQQTQQRQPSPHQDGNGGQVQAAMPTGQPTQGQDRSGIGQQQRVDKDSLPPPPSSVASDDWPIVNQRQSPDQNLHQLSTNMPNQDENKQPDIKRGRLGNHAEHPGHQHPSQSRERPTFNHYSSKPQMYNSQLPFHMHQLGMYAVPPPPPPPPPPMDNSGGQYNPYYQQPHPQPQPQFNSPPTVPAPGGYAPYCMPPQ